MSGSGASKAAFLLREADRFISAPSRFITRRGAIRSSLVSMSGLTMIALVLVPARDSIGGANIGLTMALVVSVTGVLNGMRPGVASAIWASTLFALLHSVPHGLPRVEDEQDIATALLLIATGVLSGLIHQRREKLLHDARHFDYELGRLHRVGEVAAQATAPAQVIAAVIAEISEELGLAECIWETGTKPPNMPELTHNGLIEGVPYNAEPEAIGGVLASGVTISVGSAGWLVLTGRGRPATLRQLRVAILLADYASALTQADQT